ncbi:hypothetical protein GQ44DRAFT_773231 [Phaeosphaeriaceae sp. PMI808]|nr:hypothetical protein GQ44DRAFT_773231 [Phaeosphaeriaceae sp. PMI808]
MMFTSLTVLTIFVLSAHAQANIPIYPLVNVTLVNKTKYFSDPYHVPYQNNQGIYISGTTHQYLECDASLQPGCASSFPNKYDSDRALKQAANSSGTTICGAAGIHPFQSVTDGKRSWDAVVTLHVQDNSTCNGISGWSVIVHAHPENASAVDLPPTSWVGDKVLIGSFSEDVDANYDGKYFQTPAGQLYLVYQKQYSKQPKRDGVVAWLMDDPMTKVPGSEPIFLLLPDDDLNSENYVDSDGFKLIETGNIHAIKGKFLMAYSVGAYNHQSYKMGIAYSDTFLPAKGQQYRKVMKNNPQHLWKSQGQKEVYYLLQADQKHPGWHYVGDKVLAPGVPTVAQIGPNGGWVATFAGYDPDDAPIKDGTNKFVASHRQPYFVNLDVNVPVNPSVKEASDAELQSWIIPAHK